MGMPAQPNYHGRQLLRHLKQLRLDEGLTAEEVGLGVHMTVQKMSRIECGQLPTYHELCALLKYYNTPEGRYVELWERARTVGWWRKLGMANNILLCSEQEADCIIDFPLTRLPSLLQSEQYASAWYQAATPSPHKPKDIRANEQLRAGRQRRLDEKDAPLLRALIYEPALRQSIVTREQLRYLTLRAQEPNITVHVVPQTQILPPGLTASTTLLQFDDPGEPDLVVTAGPTGLSQSQKEHVVSKVHAMFDQVIDGALTPYATVDLLAQLLEKAEVRRR